MFLISSTASKFWFQMLPEFVNDANRMTVVTCSPNTVIDDGAAVVTNTTVIQRSGGKTKTKVVKLLLLGKFILSMPMCETVYLMKR